MSLSHEQVQNLLPHRYPFLFVDKVTSLEPGHRVEGTFQVKGDHPFINKVGEIPVFPAFLVVEALGQVAALCIRYPQQKSSPVPGGQGFLVRIDQCSLEKPARPEDELLLTANLVRGFTTLYKFEAKGFVDGQVVVKASLTLYLEF